MFGKISTIIVLVAFMLTVAEGGVWDGFVASWALNTSTHFYNLPKTLKEAETEGWTMISGVDSPKGVKSLGFADDPTFVILFSKGKAIGFQIAVRMSDLNSRQPLQWDKLDAIIPKRLNGVSYYTATAYFYNDESTGIRKLWLQEKNRFLEIPTNASLVPLETQYLLKKCIPTMGDHYYAWVESLDCATLNPWFLLAQRDKITGVGFQGFGNPIQTGNRTWWETIPAGGIYAAMADPPQCAVDGVIEFGTISMHVWFVDEPQYVTCP